MNHLTQIFLTCHFNMITAKDIYEAEQEFRVTEGQREYLNFLLDGTGFDLSKHDSLRRSLEAINEDFSGEEYLSIREELWQNQLDRIPYGLTYNQGDIIKHLNRLR